MKAATEIIKYFEGFSPVIYRCPSNFDTFGYGSLVSTYPDVKTPISREEAEDYLLKDMRKFERGIRRLITVPLSENQMAALISFTYNLGLGALQRSTLRMKLNRGDYDGAADEFLKWDKARVGGVMRALAGLTRRRVAERNMFLG
jgi:lysozyme